MTRKTYSELKQDVLVALDMNNEDFVRESEFIMYLNDALSECEAHLVKMDKDYFLKNARLKDTTTPVPNTGLVAGTSEYAFPADIYGNKIKEMVYNNGSDVYEIRKIRGANRFGFVEPIENETVTNPYLEYLIINDSTANGMRIKMVPTPRETGDYVSIWYHRSAERIPANPTGAEYIDIPEFYTYIKAAVAAKCALKEGHPRLQALIGEWQYFRELMLTTLSEQTQDSEESLVIPDMTHYRRHT